MSDEKNKTNKEYKSKLRNYKNKNQLSNGEETNIGNTVVVTKDESDTSENGSIEDNVSENGSIEDNVSENGSIEDIPIRNGPHINDLNRNSPNINKSSTVNDSRKQPSKASPSGQQQGSSSPKTSSIDIQSLVGAVVFIAIAVVAYKYFFPPNGDSKSSSTDIDWRSTIDPDNSLSNYQRSMIRASLKPILDKSYEKDQDVGVSTLLILSPDEQSAAKLARCLLGQINKQENVNQISTEINLGSHSGGKLQLDTNLRTLLNTTDAVRAVLLRDIGKIPSKDTLEQLRLLFAYCDGENPVIPHRLIIMTANSISETEDELRQSYKKNLPAEHDFIDALMSRISGHTLYVEEDQKSIC